MRISDWSSDVCSSDLLLEAIKVEEQHAEQPAAALLRQPCLLQAILQHHAVRQPGQRIVVRHLFKLRFARQPFTDVGGDGHEHRRYFVTRKAQTHFDRIAPTIGAAMPAAVDDTVLPAITQPTQILTERAFVQLGTAVERSTEALRVGEERES